MNKIRGTEKKQFFIHYLGYLEILGVRVITSHETNAKSDKLNRWEIKVAVDSIFPIVKRRSIG